MILAPAAAQTTLMLLVEGQASFVFRDAAGAVTKSERTLISGNTFDIGGRAPLPGAAAAPPAAFNAAQPGMRWLERSPLRCGIPVLPRHA